MPPHGFRAKNRPKFEGGYPMKKFLSLVLLLEMVMFLVAVGAGAKDFTDADDITYDEAVAIISTIGVVNGYEGGGASSPPTACPAVQL